MDNNVKKAKSESLYSIDKTLLEALCGYQAPLTEIAGVLRTTEKIVKSFVKKEYKQSWESFYREKSAIGKSKLRENQFNLAKKSPHMAKDLAEKYLDTHESDQLQEAISFLSPRKRRFADKLIECEDQTESAKYAGYAEKTARIKGSQLAHDPWVLKYVNLIRERTRRRLQISREKYLNKLNEIVEDDSENRAKILAMKLIGSWEGYEAPEKHEHSGPGGGPIHSSNPGLDLSKYSLSELETLKNLLAKQTDHAEQEDNHR